MSKNVVVAMSGGVDSSATALMLLEKGYNVRGVTMLLNDTEAAKKSIEDAKDLAKKLKIELEVVDYRKKFEDIVVKYFVEKYKQGKTPNPCVICNKHIKFGLLNEYVNNLDYDYLATGHYANIERKDNNIYLKRANDLKKDQSYFLHMLTKEQLEKVIFPLGNVESKNDVRKYLADRGFEVATKSESQEICFIEHKSYTNFLKKRIQIKDGDIIDNDGMVLGKHNGTINYTIGQRKGLGISYKCPLFVTKIDACNNKVYVGKEENLYKDNVIIKNINILAENMLDNLEQLTCKIRYSSNDMPIDSINVVKDDMLCINFKTKQKSISPGQFAVVYNGDYVVLRWGNNFGIKEKWYELKFRYFGRK